MVWNEALPWMETFWAHSVESRSNALLDSKVQLAPLLRECLDHPISQLDNESVPTGACFSSGEKGVSFQVSSLRCAKGPLNQSQVLVAIVDGPVSTPLWGKVGPQGVTPIQFFNRCQFLRIDLKR